VSACRNAQSVKRSTRQTQWHSYHGCRVHGRKVDHEHSKDYISHASPFALGFLQKPGDRVILGPCVSHHADKRPSSNFLQVYRANQCHTLLPFLSVL
jgi:hypothetical protein